MKKTNQNHEEDFKTLPENSIAAAVLGKILQEKRQNLKIEISEISSYLKIKDRDVIAIESGDLSSITKHLYAIGLIRSYAKFLSVEQKIIEEKIKLLSIKSNVENVQHQLFNIGEENKLSPSKDSFFNFLLISILMFLVLLSLYNSYQNDGASISHQSLVSELEKIDSSK